MKEDYQKALKKSALFFLLSPVSLNGQRYQNKRSLELVTSHSSGYKTSSKKIHVLPDQVWWCNVKQFLSYSKNYICKFMQANLWHKLFHFHLSFCIWNLWKGKILQKCEYLKNEKSFSDEIKNTSQFLKGYHLVKK